MAWRTPKIRGPGTALAAGALLACANPPATELRPNPVPAPVESRVPHEIVPLPPRPNPYTAELARRAAAWRAHGLKDYVFVLQDIGQVSSRAEWNRRVVVKGGVAIESQSLSWGEVSTHPGPTMDSLFEKARYHATFGDGDVPFRFKAEYDPRFNFVRSMDSDGRETVADDEATFRVQCFSPDPQGCQPIMLTAMQCTAAGGRVTASGDSECSGFGVGLVDRTHFCCRPMSTPGYDDITAAQCRAIGGREENCGDDTLPVGGSQSRQKGCCRPFVK